MYACQSVCVCNMQMQVYVQVRECRHVFLYKRVYVNARVFVQVYVHVNVDMYVYTSV